MGEHLVVFIAVGAMEEGCVSFVGGEWDMARSQCLILIILLRDAICYCRRSADSP